MSSDDRSIEAALSWFGLNLDEISPLPSQPYDGLSQRLHFLAAPPAACPGCVAAAGQPWPADTTSKFCPRCLDRLRRVYRVHRWNADRAHQSHAGKARASHFSHAHQVAAGHASFAAFSARWRANCGLPPLFAEDVWRYVTPDMMRDGLGRPLDDNMRDTIYDAWLQGYLYPVSAWVDQGFSVSLLGDDL